MDFQQLMKQAAANQSYTQKKHEEKKRQQEVKKNREEEEKREKDRKASALLQDMRKASEKKEKEYRGIVNSRAKEYVKVLSGRSSTASSYHRKTDLNRTTPSSNRPHPLATTASSASKHSLSSSSSSKNQSHSNTKGKTKAPSSSSSSSLPKTTSKDHKSLTKLPKPTNSSTRGAHSSEVTRVPTKPSSSSSTPGQSRHQTKVKQPVNFQELMKMAEKKSTVAPGSGRPRGGATAIGNGSSKAEVKCEKGRREERGDDRSRSGSPLGKLLLEKSRERVRQKNGIEGRGGASAAAVEGRGRGKNTIDEQVPSPGQASVGSTNGSKLKELAKSRIVGRGGGSGTSRGGKTGGRGGGGGGGGGVGENTGRLPESALLMRERFRRELEASVNGSRGTNSKNATDKSSTAKSNSFYASSHSELSKNGRPNFARKKGPGGGASGSYHNSWVSEMNDYVKKMRDGESYSDEEEEDDDLDDFVVDDEEGDDVSSAIREIFGYDKRRYRDEEVDDRIMESSYAQQQYEEMRSSRIGRQEDAEDIRRENERLARKRKKEGAGSSFARGPKQSKLSF